MFLAPTAKKGFATGEDGRYQNHTFAKVPINMYLDTKNKLMILVIWGKKYGYLVLNDPHGVNY